MKKQFSNSWKSSKQVRKQRKYRARAPLHIKQKFLSAHLAKELMKKYGRRNIRVRKGDTIKVMRGEFKKHIGKVEKVFIKKSKIQIEGVNVVKKDGTKVPYLIDPSNLMITILDLTDKRRQMKLGRENEQKTS